MYQHWLSPQAEASIEEIYFRGYVEFGQRVADDYDLLIRQAIDDICDDPMRSGSKPVLGKDDGLRHYQLVLSKKRAHVDIKNPKHEVLYYLLEDQKLIVIADILRVGREEARRAIVREETIKRLP